MSDDKYVVESFTHIRIFSIVIQIFLFNCFDRVFTSWKNQSVQKVKAL